MPFHRFFAFRVVFGNSLDTLVDGLPVGMKACLELSFVVPTCDVAPLSAMADGMEPLRTLRRMDCVRLVMLCMMFTRSRGGG